MNIHGIGIDIVETKRIEKSIREFGDRFLDRIFTPAERTYCEQMKNSALHYAARFAAKEAVAKAFGTGIGKNLAWTDMEILRNEAGKPFLVLSGVGKEFAKENGIVDVPVSLSHGQDYAVANAIALAAPEPS